MNVVVVAERERDAEPYLGEWAAKLDRTLTLLTIAGRSSREGPPARVHPIDLDFGAWALHRPIVRGLFREALSRQSIRRVVLGRQKWREISWSVRSFDPDVIDLRALPDAERFGTAMGQTAGAIVLKTGAAPVSVDMEWRRYDPAAKVSIVLPIYNGGRYLHRALDSCLAQSHRNLELILVDDCSTDTTPEVIAEYTRADQRVVPVRHERNQRLPGALNAGFARATGDLLTWTSHDNLYEPDAIERMARYLASWPSVGFVYTGYRSIDDEGRLRAEVPLPPPFWNLRVHNPIGACFLYRRAVYEAVGDFRRDLEYVEDYEYWMRVAQRFEVQRLPGVLYSYRRHGDSMTSRAAELYAGLHKRMKQEHVGPGRSIWPPSS